MIRLLLVFIFLLKIIPGFSQNQIAPINVDINLDNRLDNITPTDSSLILKINNKKGEVLFGNFGFETLSGLKFTNNILLISGRNEGSGAFSWNYKFRYNMKNRKIELIGFDSFSKWVSGSITKSINLLTKQYEIILEEYNHEKNKMDISKYDGKSNFEKVILTEIVEGSFENLNEFGQQYIPQ